VNLRPDGPESDQGTDSNARAQDPIMITDEIARALARSRPGSGPALVLRAMLDGHRANQQRRAAVLAQPDLAAELTRPPLNFTRPEHWNGYIPPATWPLDDREILRTSHQARDGKMITRYNQGNARSCGDMPNSTAQRAVLVAISQAAWDRRET